jgi:uncharacterized protein YjdB
MKKTQTSLLRRSSVLGKTLGLFIFLAAVFGNLSAQTAPQPKFPFPQNYTYPFGVLPANYKNYNAELLAKYNQFMDLYYEDGVIDGVPCGRLMFKQSGENGDATVSEGIAYGMLLTVYMAGANGDEEYDRFKRMWNYYKKNSNSRGIMNWKVDQFTGDVIGGDPNNANGATDAELDAAQALLMAYKQWGDQEFYNDAIDLIGAIWDHEVDYKFVLKPGDAFDDYKNPCYFVTNAMELFARVDPNPARQWDKAIEEGYKLIKKVQNPSTGLIPDWVRNDATYSYISGIEGGKFSSNYLYDAVRTQWRMAQAYSWYGHEDAKDISALLTRWAVGESKGEPMNMKDGYTLSGGVPHDPLIPYFKDKGLWSNACFTGGFASGGLVDEEFQSFIDRGYSALGTAYTDPSSYFVDATHLLYMLYMGGNMPNLYDMLPEFVSAETNEDGSAIFVKFTKDIDVSTVVASLAGWSVKSDFGNITNTISSIEAIDAVTVKLNFDQVIEDEYQIVSYSGATGLKSIEGSNLNRFSTDLSVLDNTGLTNYRFVTDLRTNKRPIITQAVTNMDGNEVILLFDQNLLGATVITAGFSLTANGNPKTFSEAVYNIQEPNKMVLKVGDPADFSTWIAEGDVLLLSYSGTRLAATNRQRVKAFTNRMVRNNTVVQKCNLISSFESGVTQGGSWDAPFDTHEEWTATTANPKPSSLVNNTATCVEYVRTAASTNKDNANSAPKFNFNTNMHGSGTINTLLQDGQTLFTFMLHTPNAAGSVVKLAFYDSGNDEWYNSPYLDYSYTIPAAAATDWVEVSIDMENDKDFKGIINAFEIAIDKGTEGDGQRVYLDEFQLCSPIPSTEIRGAMVNYDGKSVTLSFGNDMNIPADAGNFEVGVRTAAGISYQKATSAAADPDNSRKLILGLPFTISASQKNVFVKYESGSAASLDGRPLVSFLDYPVVNATGRVITRGWRDDFDDLTDHVTKSLGGPDFTMAEKADGTFSVKAKADDAWKSFGVTVMDELWDLSKNQTVTVRVKSAGSFYLRSDLKDLTNDRNTDGAEVIRYTGAGQWQEMEFDFTGLWKNVYGGANAGAVNSEAIYQALFYPWSEPSSAANSYAPPTYTGEILFDYIAIGASVVVKAEDKLVDEGTSTQGWASVDNAVLYTVPTATVRSIAALEAAVAAGTGAKVNAPVKGTKYDLGINNLVAGGYALYAYEPASGAISIKLDLALEDVTPPVFTYSLPNPSLLYELNSVVTVRMNEPGYIIMVDGSLNLSTLTSNQILSSTYSIARIQIAAADVNVSKPFVLNKLSTATGFKIFAMDSKGLLSEITPVFNVQDTRPPVLNVLTTQVPWIISPAGTDALSECDDISVVGVVENDIEFTVSKVSELFLVPAGTSSALIETADANSEFVASFIDIGSVDVSKTQIMTTADFEFANCFLYAEFRPGEYWIYAKDANGNVSEPAPVFIGDVVLNGVASIALSPTAPAAITTVGGTRSLSLAVTAEDPTKPANITSTVWGSSDITIASVSGNASGATITGVSSGTATITVTVTDAKGVVKTATATVVVDLPVEPSSITITSPSIVELIPGQNATVTATVAPTGASQNLVITSTSSDITIIGNTITAESVSVATAATVTVYPEGYPALAKTITVNITPADKPVVTLSLSAAQTLKVDELLAITASVTNATDLTVTWASSAEAVATVSAGTVTAVYPGTATITATSVEDPTSSASITITVVKKAPSALRFGLSELTFVAGSSTPQILLPIFGSGDEALTTDLAVTWASTNPAILVSNNGSVSLGTAAASGTTATITATSVADPSLAASIDVIVVANEVPLISLEVASPLTLGIAQTGNIEFTYNPTGTTQQGVTYATSSSAIIDVDPATGAYEAIAAGNATITVSSTANPAIFSTIQVTVAEAQIEGVTVNSPTMSLDLQQTKSGQITARFTPTYATNDLVYSVTGTAVTVSLTGFVTAVSEGEATVRVASASNPQAFADVAVTVAAGVVPVESVSLSAGYPATVKAGDVINLAGYITVLPTDATNKAVTLTVSPASAATVTGTSFTVSSTASGSFTVTAVSNNNKTAVASFTVQAPVSGVAITGDSEVVVGGMLTLTATVTGGSGQGVTWSSNVAGITVSPAGVVSVATTVAANNYTITATSIEDATVFGTKTISVTTSGGTLNSISIPTSLNVVAGQTLQITATTDPLSFSGIVTWSIVGGTTSGDLSITTSKNVTLTAGASAGTILVKATMEGKESNTVTVTVLDASQVVPITGVSVSSSLPATIAAGGKIDLADYFTKQPSTATENLTFTVSGGTRVGNMVTAAASGQVTIKATWPGNSIGETRTITITTADVPMSDIILSNSGDNVIVEKGKTSTSVTISSSNAATTNKPAVEVTIADGSIAELIVDGQNLATDIKVKGLAPGKTTVTVAAVVGTASSSFEVIVPYATTNLSNAIAKAELVFTIENAKAKIITLEQFYAGIAAIAEAKTLLADAEAYKFDVVGAQSVIDIEALKLEALIPTSSKSATSSYYAAPNPCADFTVIYGGVVNSVKVVSNGAVLLYSQGSYVDMSRLSAGTYILVAETEDGTVEIKVVKQ